MNQSCWNCFEQTMIPTWTTKLVNEKLRLPSLEPLNETGTFKFQFGPRKRLSCGFKIASHEKRAGISWRWWMNWNIILFLIMKMYVNSFLQSTYDFESHWKKSNWLQKKGSKKKKKKHSNPVKTQERMNKKHKHTTRCNNCKFTLEYTIVTIPPPFWEKNHMTGTK